MRAIFFPKKRAETPIFIVFFGNRCFGKKTNLDQIITSKRAKLGPDNNSTAYIYIYAVKLLSGPSLGFLKVIIWSKLGFLKVIIWSKFVFLAYKYSGFKRFVLHTQLSFCVFFCAQLSGNFLEIAFFKKGCKNWVFQISVFSV